MKGLSSVRKHLEKCPNLRDGSGGGKEKPCEGSDAVLAHQFLDHFVTVSLQSECFTMSISVTVGKLPYLSGPQFLHL